MGESDQPTGDTGGSDRRINRRTVLKGAGAGAVAGVGFVGTSSGHWVEGKPVFCGCDQLCVCVEGDADVLMAVPDGNGGYDVGFVVGDGKLDPYPQGEPHYSGDFCVSTDDEGVPDGKIIGLQVAGKRWVNPDRCAQEALAAEQEQLDSTHPRPEGVSGGPCGKPPCDHPTDGKDEETGEIQVKWQDCETVRVTGSDEGLEGITVYAMRCFPGEGPCPDDNLGVTVEDPELPLTIDDRHLEVDGDDVPYYIWGIELQGDVEQDFFRKPDDLECTFGPPHAIAVTYDDCETVTLEGPDEDLDRIDVYLIRCFDDGSSHKTPLDGATGCPTGHVVSVEDPDLPLTLGRDDLALGDEQYVIDMVHLLGVDGPDNFTEPPADFDCGFEAASDEVNIEFEMDDETITLTENEDAVSQVTITGAAESGYAGWDEDVGHAFITSWAQSDADIDFPDRDIQRYFDVDSDTDVVRKDVEITFDVPPEVGDPASGEAIETAITGHLFLGLERGTDPETSESIGDWRDDDPMTLTVERE